MTGTDGDGGTCPISSTRLSQSVDIVVTSYSGPLGGTYSADSAGKQRAQGMVSGTVLSDAIDGGTYAITDGAFDLTVTLTGG